MSFNPTPTVFLAIGPVQITWYALCILTGVFITYALTQKTLKRWGYGPALLEDYAIPAFLVAILGARFYYVLFQWSYYAKYPEEIIKIWNGGLAVHGGILACLLYSYFYFKNRKVSFWRMADALLPNVLIGQACGRWGNFFNQEAYGNIVDASFYQHFPNFIKEKMYIDGFYRQPTFLFECVLNIVGWIVITFIFRKKAYRKHGDCGWAYFIWYGMVRFLIEALRSDSLMLGPMKVAQLISLVFIVVGLIGYKGWFHHYKQPVLCFACQKQPMHTIQLLKENGFQTVVLNQDSSANEIVQAADHMNQGHDDCILITDMVQEIEQGRKSGLYTILLSEENSPNKACQYVSCQEDLYYVVQEEKSWSDNTIW